MKKIKKRVYEIIEVSNSEDTPSKIFDFFIIGLIIINVIMVITETFYISESTRQFFRVVECVSVIVYTIEYILRVWTANLLFPKERSEKARIKYIFSFMALIDLLAILPFYIPFIIKLDLRVLRTLRVIRLLRLFKINRYTNALATIGDVFKKKANQLLSSIMVVTLLMIISSVLMYNVENPAQPNAFQNAFSGLWWAVATFTTVGYGDIYPITVMGRVLSGIIAILGIGLVAVPTGIISAGFIENFDEDKTKHKEKHFCPYCGNKVETTGND